MLMAKWSYDEGAFEDHGVKGESMDGRTLGVPKHNISIVALFLPRLVIPGLP